MHILYVARQLLLDNFIQNNSKLSGHNYKVGCYELSYLARCQHRQDVAFDYNINEHAVFITCYVSQFIF